MSITGTTHTLHGIRILVIDDDRFSLDMTRRMLRHFGAEVHTAANGREGFKTAQHTLPQLIISDLSMPGLDGWELLKILKQTPELADVPVIALTAQALTDVAQQALQAGYARYITKPLTPSDLIEQCLAVLNSGS